jgi:phage terminase large subunit-like protein
MTKYFTHYLKHGYQEKRAGKGCEEVVKATSVYNGVDYSKVYDYYYYINKYPDIKKYYSKDDVATLKHFVEHGMAEGRQAISSFDVRAYRNNYPDLNKNFGNDWKKYFIHYMNHGYKEKRSAVGTEVSNPVTVYRGVDYSAVYDFNYYINKYPDMYKYYSKNDVGALKHFVEHGMAEGRQGCAAFNVQVYRSKSPDLNGHFGNDLKKYYIHYKDHGRYENRVSTANKVDKPITVYNGVDYSKVYDFNYYINTYPDMKKYYANNDVAALRHFVYHGMAEGRQAKASFNPKAYRANNADLNGYFGNDYVKYYVHYMNHGIYEGRKGN